MKKLLFLLVLLSPGIIYAQWPTSSANSATAQQISDTANVLRAEMTSTATIHDTADVLRTEIGDSLDAREIKTNGLLGKKAFWGATDSLGSVTEQIELELDSTLQLAGHQVRIAGPLPSAITIAPIHTVGGPTTVNLTAAYYYNDSLWTDASATAIITSPAATTDEYIGAWQSTLNNATVPVNNFIWLTFTAVTTASNKFIVVIRYHYGSS